MLTGAAVLLVVVWMPKLTLPEKISNAPEGVPRAFEPHPALQKDLRCLVGRFRTSEPFQDLGFVALKELFVPEKVLAIHAVLLHFRQLHPAVLHLQQQHHPLVAWIRISIWARMQAEEAAFEKISNAPELGPHALAPHPALRKDLRCLVGRFKSGE